MPDFKNEEDLAAFRKRRVRFALRMRYGLAPAPGSHTLRHIVSHTTYLNPHNWVYDHLSVYVFYRANWNTDLDVDALLDEYYRLFYGRGAVPMGRFWDEVEVQFTKTLSKVIQDPLGSRGIMQPDGEG